MNAPIPLSSCKGLLLELFGSKVPAGFPSPAADHSQKRIDLTEELVLHPEATFLLVVSGRSMEKAGIFDGDVVMVDKAVEPTNGLIVVAVVDGEFTIKRLYKKGRTIKLLPENDEFEPIEFAEGQELVIWGVVTWTFRRHFTATKRRHARKAA